MRIFFWPCLSYLIGLERNEEELDMFDDAGDEFIVSDLQLDCFIDFFSSIIIIQL